MEQYEGCSKPRQIGQEPYVTTNYIDARVKCYATGQILSAMTFSACQTVTGKLNWTPSGHCSSPGSPYTASGWGTQGTFQMSAVASILRPAKTDVNGKISDVVGMGRMNFNMDLNKSPGGYSCSSGWDTAAAVKADMSDMLNECREQLLGAGPDFIPSLIDI